ncbi:MAG: GDP-mannose 4,6-dehydratase [Candidatus Lokiarchaeota archaeon]|nr:GDP-mannose 4,6-dehydratase [Candidatus Lokiarchaeota archaeon]
MIKNKTILITGGAGFIGSNLAQTLLKEDNYILIIDNFNDFYPGKKEQLETILEPYKHKIEYNIINGDLVNKSIFQKIDMEVDYIFHLAAQPGVRYSINNIEQVSHNNMFSTIKIYEYALEKNVKKVLYASSSSVYGNPLYTPVDEDHPKNPISPYAISKWIGEIYADYYYRELNLPISTLRFYTVYGPFGRPDMAIRKFFDLILHNKKLTIFGDGNQLRDFTYVSDIINGLILSCENKKAEGETFNLGSSNPITVNELIDKIYKITEKNRNVEYIEKQKGDIEVTFSNIEKAQRILGFKPKFDIDVGLEKTYNWQLNNS